MVSFGVTIEAVMMIIWIALILVVGLQSRSRINNSDEFMVGGRAIPVWMLGMWSAGAAVSAWTFFGLPGAIYTSGALQYWAVFLPICIGFPITVLVLGRWMRVSARKYSLMTMPDFLGEVYSGKLIRIFAAIGIVIACVFYATAQFRAIGILLDSLFGITGLVGNATAGYEIAAALGIVVTMIYILLGGFIAGAIINVFNVSMMIVASLVAVGLGYLWTGGYGNMLQVISTAMPTMLNTDLALGGSYWGFWISWAILLASFGMIGQPAIVQKLYGIKKPSTLWIWGLIGAIIFGITCPAYCYLGEVTRYLATVTPQVGTDITSLGYGADGVIVWLTTVKLANDAPFLGGLLIAGVLSAAWSTVDGLLMMGGAAVARDVLNKCFRPNWTDKQLLFNMRLWMFIVGILIVIETIFPLDIINWLAAIGWASFAATLAPALIMAVIWKGITKWGGAAGVFTGLIVSTFLTLVYRLPKSSLAPWGFGTTVFIKTFYLDAGAWGMIAGFAAIIIVSLITKKERGPLYYDIHKSQMPATLVAVKAVAPVDAPAQIYNSYTKTWYEVDPKTGQKKLNE